MNRPIVRVEGVGKQYRLGEQAASYTTLTDMIAGTVKSFRRAPRREEFWALKNVSFEVPPGQVLGVIGRNGAGKSTLLKILSRITEPTTGAIDLYGRVSSLLEVGTGFHPELSGRENIFLNGAILGMSRREVKRRFDEIVEFSEVEGFLDTPVKRYSSGMYTRLAFAVAAHLNPEVLIVDEVLAVGDAQFQRKCLGQMGKVANEGRTVLLVSHNMAAIQAFCHRVILLSQGTLAFDGDPATGVAMHLGAEEISTASAVDLRDHPGRATPAASAAFEQLRFVNSQGEAASTFEIGETIEFEVSLTPKEALANPVVSLVISRQGMEIVTLSSHYMHKEPLPLEGKCTVRCRWEPGWLTPGIYTVDLLGLRRYTSGDRLDVIERVAQFEIADGDVYGTGRRAGGNGVLVAKGCWSR